MHTYEAILFDLDGTLLPMDLEQFTKGYFGLLARRFSQYDSKTLISAVWEGTRAMTANDQVLQAPIESVMTKSPVAINQRQMAVEILKLIEHRKIDDVVAVDDEGRFVGMVDIQDLPKFKVM